MIVLPATRRIRMSEPQETANITWVAWIALIRRCAQKSTFLIWWSDLTDTQGGVANVRASIVNWHLVLLASVRDYCVDGVEV